MVLGWRVSCARTVCFDRRLGGVLVSNELLNFLAVHILHNVVSLPFLETEANALICQELACEQPKGYLDCSKHTRVILIIRLILVILDLDEIRVHRSWIQTQTHQRINRCRLWNASKRPALLILELNQIPIILDDLIALIHAGIEQFR